MREQKFNKNKKQNTMKLLNVKHLFRCLCNWVKCLNKEYFEFNGLSKTNVFVEIYETVGPYQQLYSRNMELLLKERINEFL